MAPVPFPLGARFYLSTEDSEELETADVARLIHSAFPNAMISWDRGKEYMSRDLQRLIDMGTPEVIYRGHKSLIDRTILVEISVEGFDSILSGYTCGFYHYDGCIGFSCEPFDIEALKKGAKQFSERLDLCLNLSFGDVGELNLNVVPGRIRPGEITAERFPRRYFGDSEFQDIPDWRSSLHTACLKWIQMLGDERVKTKLLESFDSANAVADGLIERINSIDAVVDCSSVYFQGNDYHSSAVISYADWTALLNFPGVRGRLIER